MAPDIFLYEGESNPSDVRLADPTVLRSGGPAAQTIAAYSILTSEAWGSPYVRQIVAAGMLASAEAFGALRITRVLYGTTLDSLEAVGVPTPRRIVEDGSVASAESVAAPGGFPIVRAGSIQSGETVGQPTVLGPITLHVAGIASGETFGRPLVEGGIVATPEVGSPWPVPHRGWSPPQERPSEPLVERPRTLTVGLSSIESAEAHGVPRVDPLPLLEFEFDFEAEFEDVLVLMAL